MVKQSKFEKNFARIYGGSICLFNNVNGTLINNAFTENIAGYAGGAIALIGAHIVKDEGMNIFCNLYDVRYTICSYYVDYMEFCLDTLNFGDY